MRIALAHKRLDLSGGTERDFYRTAEGLRDLGHEVHLFCGEFRIPQPIGTHAHKVPSGLGRTTNLWRFALSAPRQVYSQRWDVVMGFGRMVRQDVLRCGGGTHRTFLEKVAAADGWGRRFWHRASPYHRSVLAIERTQYRCDRFKRILAVSGEVKRDIVSTYGVPEGKVSVLYNGVDLLRYRPHDRMTAKNRVSRSWRVPADAPLCLFVGSGFRRKGLDRLLKAWGSPRLRNIYLLVAGEDGQAGRYAAYAQRLAGDRIIFAGRQETVEELYKAADLLVLPAYQEAFGNVVMEALASGLPAIVSPNVGAAEILSGGLRQGILQDPEDPSELESKILHLSDRSRWSSLSRLAREVAERYSWKNHFYDLEGYLTEVASEVRLGPLA